MTARRRVLVVDDQQALAENMGEILEAAGYEALLAQSADQAVALASDGDLVALITDFRLGGATGADLIARLRDAGSAVPAIVVTALTDAGTVGRARHAGAAFVLTKPVDIPALLRLVDGLPGPGPR